MLSPYKGKFRVSQQYKGSVHDGLDLVGIDSKTIYSTVDGTVEYAGWESAVNHKKGFGRYVRIKQSGSQDRYYFGHLLSIAVKKNQVVKVGDILGVEGSTGNSTGSHCHYCVRESASKAKIKDISAISLIPNKLGTYIDDDEKLSEKENLFYPRYTGKSVSIVDALKSLKIDTKFSFRKKIAKVNGISAYLGTAKQNTKMLTLLKQGKLIKP